jgi:glycine hydroxymethyltransferase
LPSTFEYPHLAKADPEILDLVRNEEERQRSMIELIPSENYCTAAVQEASANVFTNKYSEGLPGRRYYGGQEQVDPMERLARKRACELFGAEHANVQPYSGSVANIAALFCLLDPGDRILSLRLEHGGHLSHGMHLNYSGRVYDIVSYGLRESDGYIDMDEVARLAEEHRPKLVIAGFSAYPREIEWQRFVDIAHGVGARILADISHTAGLIAGGALFNPVPLADVAMTTTHKTLRGPRGALLMCKGELAKDLDRAVFPGIQGGPHENVVAAKAVAFHEAAQPAFREYAARVVANSKALSAALVAGGLDLVTGGSDNHLALIDLRNKGVRGRQAEQALEKAGIICNRNTIPFDDSPPLNPGGIRIGTPGVTTRGMGEPEMAVIAECILQAVDAAASEDESAFPALRERIRELASAFPPPVDRP